MVRVSTNFHIYKAALRYVENSGNIAASIDAAREKNDGTALAYLELAQKAAVSGMTPGNTPSLIPDITTSDVILYNRGLSAFGRLCPYGVQTQAEVSVPGLNAGTNNFWIGPGQPLPLTKAVVAALKLPPTDVAAISVISQELARCSNAQTAIQNQMDQDNAAAVDMAAFDVDNAGIANVKPAALTYAAPKIASSGNLGTDLKNGTERVNGNLAKTIIVCRPETAVEMALARDAAGSFLFGSVGASGGSVVGFPVVTSPYIPESDSSGTGPLILVDASQLVFFDEGITLATTNEGDLAMLDDPTNGGQSMVSMWQTNSVAVKCVHRIGWQMFRPDAVVVITGARY